MIKILDCTLRDGGYYTNWDFKKSIVDVYIEAMNTLPVDYVEVGYRNKPNKDYLGLYGYCPIFELEYIREKSQKKLAIILNEKDVRPTDLDYLLCPIVGLVDMVRIAIDPENFDRAIILASAIKQLGFEVSFNIMYMSKWKNIEGFIDNKLSSADGVADVISMVDSYGGILPNEVKEIVALARKNVSCQIGFHGHNNLHMALINAVTAIDAGADVIDVTVLGMGRGAGNLNLELLLTYLNKHTGVGVDFNALGELIMAFNPLHKQYGWGTNLPYMLSGANSIPQKDVMNWISNRLYSFNDIVRALDNKKENKTDNDKFPIIQSPIYNKVIIIGGGESAQTHFFGIKNYINREDNIAIIHATARNASLYLDINVPQFICLVGSESRRLNRVLSGAEFKNICILAPYPRTMGTCVTDNIRDRTYELNEIEFTTEFLDSCTTVALQTALTLGAKDVMIVGYDGYSGNILSEKEAALTNENRTLFYNFSTYSGKKIQSLTPTIYKELEVVSVYQNL